MIHSAGTVKMTSHGVRVQCVFEIGERLREMAELGPANIQMQKTGSAGYLSIYLSIYLSFYPVRPSPF